MRFTVTTDDVFFFCNNSKRQLRSSASSTDPWSRLNPTEMPCDPYEPSFSKDGIFHDGDLLHLIFGETGCNQIGVELRDNAYMDPLSSMFKREGESICPRIDDKL